ncbi:coiled-coil domain-containing protein 97 isoform X1 [Elephas maximus indicus]|uniref:coiled-coil domain-containing protein 97 isoform X1 n=1 Tax=Elephas maximus indicus TaxID=99487 RepID=UPI002115F750|nr:coiled-coil domain-containing protein 97 isoform X1 [Elephas maximus indicus]
MEAVATAAAAREPDEGCTEPSPSHWGELSWTPVPPRPQDKVDASEEAPGALDNDPPGAESPAVSAMLRAVAASRLPVCSQQRGEPDLTEREKVAILGRLYHEKPLVFLERFRTGLREEHLACFGHLRGDHRADFYCAEVARQGTARPRALRTRLRNRRYAALRELIQGGEYFSDEQMRFRAPLLYEQYIGQYLTQEELSARTPFPQSPKPGSPGTPVCPLSDLLLQSYQERELQQRLLQQQEEEEACLEEEEEEEDSDEEDKSSGKDSEAWVPDSEERLILREEFTSRMHQRFLDGKDGDFDYSTVDDNPDLDNLDIVARDEEERYFDEQEPEDAPSPAQS